jgi:hypothetical protein
MASARGVLRRKVLLGLPAAVAAAGLPALFAPGVARAQVAEGTAAALAIGKALDVFGSLVANDGGLGAMLRADHAYSQLIANELNSLLSYVADIKLALDVLPAREKALFEGVISVDHANQVIGAAVWYAATDAGAPQNSAAYWKNNAVKSALDRNLQQLETNLIPLSVTDQGKTEVGAMVAPLALSTQVALDLRAGLPNSAVASIIRNIYLPWFGTLLGASPPSLLSQIATYVKAHDDKIDELAKVPHHAQLGIARFKSASRFDAAPSRPDISLVGGWYDIEGRGNCIGAMSRLPGAAAFSYQRLARLQLADWPEVGAARIEYDSGLAVMEVRHPDGTIDLPPGQNDICQGVPADRSLTDKTPTSALTAAFEATDAYKNAWVSDHIPLQLAIDELNLLRAKVCYALKLRQAVAIADAKAKETLKYLS